MKNKTYTEGYIECHPSLCKKTMSVIVLLKTWWNVFMRMVSEGLSNRDVKYFGLNTLSLEFPVSLCNYLKPGNNCI
jgi:hypothetical protein